MNNSKNISLNEIEKIKKNIIKKSFPELNNIKIILIEKNRGKYSAMVRKNWSKYLLFVNRNYLEIYEKKEIKGLLAHELSHIFQWATKGILFYIINSLKCSFSKKYLAFHEKETDKIAICKGYRKEIKAQRKKRESYPDKNYYKNKKFYFSSEEIDHVKCK
jgi:beta-lactamase regulating signal transducer with metallopeptidase domain